MMFEIVSQLATER